MTLLRLFAFKPMQKGQVISNENNILEETPKIDFEAILPTQQEENNSVLRLVAQNKYIEEQENEQQTNEAIINQVSEFEKVNVHTEDLIEANNSFAKLESQSDGGLDEAESKHEQELSQQVQAIEQQAAQLLNADPHAQPNNSLLSDNLPLPDADESAKLVQEEQSSQPVKTENSTSFDTSMNSVLTTRNMLRSRKKQLDAQGKKSNGAIERQDNLDKENSVEHKSVEVEEKKIELPKPEQPYQAESIDPATIRKANQVDQWAHMIDSMELIARLRQLAIHATIDKNSTEDNLILRLDQATKHLYTEVAQQQLEQSISQFLSRDVKVTINIVEQTVADPYKIQSHINDKRYGYAKELLESDDIVQGLVQTFQATLDDESISAV